jgi:CHASE2 domain-containing sensor protein
MMKKKTKLLIKDSFFSSILTAIIVLFLAITLVNITFFNPFIKAFEDFDFLDMYYAENFGNTDAVNTDIILVNVQNNSRETIANMLKEILKEEPRVIGLDVIFKDLKDFYSDSLLASVLANDKIITAYNYNDEIYQYSNPLMVHTNKQGFTEINFDQETYVMRNFRGIKTAMDGTEHLSFASQVAKQYLGDSYWHKLEYDNKLRDLNTIKYYGDYNSFRFLDSSDFFASYNKKSGFKDKIVLLGFFGVPTGNPLYVEDMKWTPLNNSVTGKSLPDMFGVVIHANIINMLIKNDFIYRLSNLWLGIIMFFCMFFCTMYFIKINKKYKISYRTRKRIFLFVFTIVLMGLALFLFKRGIILRPIPIIAVAILAGSYFKYYKHLVRYIKTKRKWKTYIK